VAKPSTIQLARGPAIDILYDDRAVLAIDKPAGWVLAPDSWNVTGRNLQLALVASIRAGDHWAKARHITFLRYVHRLDAGTTGVLLLAKSPGAVSSYSALFKQRAIEKVYLAIVHGCPSSDEWNCTAAIRDHPSEEGKMVVDRSGAAQATETLFRVIQRRPHKALIEARPITGRTHQIRIHLAESGFPVVGDEMYGKRRGAQGKQGQLCLRAVSLAYRDPFNGRRVRIVAPADEFARRLTADQRG
jgi:23S rRNA pseudouridine1911/1915/1917 synthase